MRCHRLQGFSKVRGPLPRTMERGCPIRTDPEESPTRKPDTPHRQILDQGFQSFENLEIGPARAQIPQNGQNFASSRESPFQRTILSSIVRIHLRAVWNFSRKQVTMSQGDVARRRRQIFLAFQGKKFAAFVMKIRRSKKMAWRSCTMPMTRRPSRLFATIATGSGTSDATAFRRRNFARLIFASPLYRQERPKLAKIRLVGPLVEV